MGALGVPVRSASKANDVREAGSGMALGVEAMAVDFACSGRSLMVPSAGERSHAEGVVEGRTLRRE